MKTILEKASNMKTSILRFGAQARAVIREVCTFEFLGLATMLLPALMASVGFFFGKTVSPIYFYAAVAILTCAAFLVGWCRGLAYLALLAVCTVLTMYTFSYTQWDAQTYHFPMQYLLHHGWNPVFDSTLEKFAALTGDAWLSRYHALFLPKFSSLCGAIVASSFGLFVGDAFLGYVLVACLFSTCMKFASRYWQANVWLRVLFATSMTFTSGLPFLCGVVDYSTYASFGILALTLVLYVRDRRLSDLVLFVFAACICMSSKTTGIMNCGLLVIMTLPLLYKRVAYWRALFITGILVVVVGAAPILTNWIQYGSPFYPSMTFDPNVTPIDITSDFTGNADALSMGYLSRICYAWISPKLTVAAIRWLEGNPDFNPVFEVTGGVAGRGQMFCLVLLFSAFLLIVSRKNLVTLLCVVLFVSAGFAPLKYIGYSRYFIQIGLIPSLAIMNFICTARSSAGEGWMRYIRTGFAILGVVCLLRWSVVWVVGEFACYGKTLVAEKYRQDMIATFPRGKPVKVSETDYRLTTIMRFRQAGLQMVKTTDGKVDTVILNESALFPCYDSHRELYENLETCFTASGFALFNKFHWLDVFDNLPHVLWDDNTKGVAK